MSAILKLSRHVKNIITSPALQKRFQQTRTRPKPKVYISHQVNEMVPVFLKAGIYADRIAVKDTLANYTYSNLFMGAKELSNDITSKLGGKTDEQVLFLCPNDASYVITQWAIWLSGSVAVPVSPLHPESVLEYYAKDCNSKLLIATPEYAELMHKVAKTCDKPLLVLDEKLKDNSLRKNSAQQSDLEAGQELDFYRNKNAMIIYTSGTTGNPKGVVLTHKNLMAQVNTLVDAWKWTSNDTILHVLPLHHVHGIVNALLCPLYVGAKCNMLPSFDANTVWSSLLGISNTNPDDRKITIFMAVPTIYVKLIEEYERVFSKDSKMTDYIEATLKAKIRLMISGSAPLPLPVYEKWLNITGHRLLERYGMTETGMCLSQEYDSEREPGYIGVPLPGVSVKIGRKPEEDEGDYITLLEATNKNNNVKVKVYQGINMTDPVGELMVKGDGVFKEYYNKPAITAAEFTMGNWFKTGDICQYSAKRKLFKILGRKNVDIIKTGGYKVSALEVETKILGHPNVVDCSVVGLPDEKWGEAIAAIIVLKAGTEISTDILNHIKKKSPKYSVPKVWKIVDSIPKNAMGKVNKKELIAKLFNY